MASYYTVDADVVASTDAAKVAGEATLWRRTRPTARQTRRIAAVEPLAEALTSAAALET